MIVEADAQAVIVAPRGLSFYVTIVGGLFFGALTALYLALGIRGELTPREVVVFDVIFGTLAALSVAGLVYYRQEGRLVMDSTGIRIVRGRRVPRSLRWGEITEVRFGTRDFHVPPFWSWTGPFIQVRTRRFLRRIYFDGVGYRVPVHEVGEFAEIVAREAARRAIPVLREHVRGGYLP